MTNTIWNGYRRSDVEYLQRFIPVMGECSKGSKLEEWRKYQNAYYRWKNDGDSPRNKLRHMAARFGMTPRFFFSEQWEELGRLVLEAALTEVTQGKELVA